MMGVKFHLKFSVPRVSITLIQIFSFKEELEWYAIAQGVKIQVGEI